MFHDNEGEAASNLSVIIPTCNEVLTLPDPLGDLGAKRFNRWRSSAWMALRRMMRQALRLPVRKGRQSR